MLRIAVTVFVIIAVGIVLSLAVSNDLFSSEYSTYPANEPWPPHSQDLIGLTNGTAAAPHYWQGWNPGGIQIIGPHTNAYQFTYTLPQKTLKRITSFHLLWYNTYQLSHTPEWIKENTYLIIQNITSTYQPTTVENIRELPGVYPYRNQERGQHITWDNLNYTLTNETTLTFTIWTDPGPYRGLWTHCFTPYFHKDVPDFNGDGTIKDIIGYTATITPSTNFSTKENTPENYEAVHWITFQKG